VGNITVDNIKANGEKRFMAIFKNAAVGIFLVDREGNFFETNGAFCEMIGYTASELKSMNCNEVSHNEDKELHIEFFDKLSRGVIEKYYLEKRFIKKDNSVIWVRLTFSAVRDDTVGNFLYSIAVVENITPQKEAEHNLENILSKIILDWNIDDTDREIDRQRLRTVVSNLQL
jgi:PAS domain S-box-containing protein